MTWRKGPLDALAVKLVGDGKTDLFFVSNKEGQVMAVFTDRVDAVSYGEAVNGYIEDRHGEMQNVRQPRWS